MSDKKLNEDTLSAEIEIEQVELSNSRFLEAGREARLARNLSADAPLASKIEVSILDREAAQLDMLSGKLQLAKQLDKLLAAYKAEEEPQ